MRQEKIEEACASGMVQSKKRMSSAEVPLSGTIIQQKADHLSLQLKLDNFKSSNGWFHHFKEQHNFATKTVCGESQAVDKTAASDWLQSLQPIIDQYAPRDVFNMDETGVFYNLVPNKTLTVKGENCHGGKHNDIRKISMSWDDDSPEIIKNCFTKSGLGQQIVEDDETVVPVEGWEDLKKHLAVCNDFEEFVHVNDHVSTSATPTAEELMGPLQSSETPEQENEDELLAGGCGDSVETVRTLPSTRDAKCIVYSGKCTCCK
ncbi:hypothetical protein PR048_026537 [Dryococelus australis]|uniref:HTH CENPB-type domain-containing protein n=1 Tax=Dryococelus australis TaxID=614101 RepID=A0ABQ9GLL6_9NEOP|nr:hypothetical protein PR048_026537 [Dryococelus australis]